MKRTPRGLRPHIALLGRRNAGKSSLLNALTHQTVSIVSEQPGTTTDPVHKPTELQPVGPVVFIDTAGLDDEGALGEARVRRTHKVLERTDVALLVAPAGSWGPYEEALLDDLARRSVPTVVALNHSDRHPAAPELLERLTARGLAWAPTVASTGEGVAALRQALIAAVPAELSSTPSLLGDLIGPGDLVVLVTPIDMEAPRGRLIMPQVQAIRDVLDHDAFCLVVKERELRPALQRLNQPPALVVTDSQAFLKVAADTPPEVPMTSFSILFARLKGDLAQMVDGARAIDTLTPGDRVLIAEACSHHAVGDDIGRVKIPRWLTGYVGGKLHIDHLQGRDWPTDLSPYSLVIHCGACMWNGRQVQSRLQACHAAGVPVTNYGVAISWSLGIFERALAVFRERSCSIA